MVWSARSYKLSLQVRQVLASLWCRCGCVDGDGGPFHQASCGGPSWPAWHRARPEDIRWCSAPPWHRGQGLMLAVAGPQPHVGTVITCQHCAGASCERPAMPSALHARTPMITYHPDRSCPQALGQCTYAPPPWCEHAVIAELHLSIRQLFSLRVC